MGKWFRPGALMGKWIPRGVVFAALMVVVRLVQGVLIDAFESKAGLISLTLMVVFVIAVMVWGYSDGRADAKANPDPDRRGDLAMRWLSAGLFAGLLSGLVAWIIGQVYEALYVSTIFNELTSFAAFTALLIFGSAVAAVMLGRHRIDKHHAKNPQRHHGLAAEGQPATDVFAAVGTAPVATEQAADASESDTSATLASPGGGFTTEEFPADADETGPETQPGDSAK